MTARNLSVDINGTIYPIKEREFRLQKAVDETSKCVFTVFDSNGSAHFQRGQEVTVTDSVSGIRFTGFVYSPIEKKIATNNAFWHKIECRDNHESAGCRQTNKQYKTPQYAGIIVADTVNDVLASEGVVGNFAIRHDDTTTDFGQGTLSGTRAVNNGLELALAGSQVTISEATTSDFSSGSLFSVTATNNTLIPTSAKAIKMQCTMSGKAIDNTYTYVKIYQPASTMTVISSRYLFYRVWIDPTSPECKFAVDIRFTDGTTLRDNFTDEELSQNNLSPHPGTDLAGYADQGKWYGRTFLLDHFVGKDIAYLTIACEGDKPGVYTAYFKDILYLNGSFSTVNTFFSTSLNVSPPQQMQNQGYSTTSVSVVDTYDTANSFRTSSSYSVSSAGILKSSFISWKADEPEHTELIVKYSIDGGNSYIRCTNNAALPILPAGSSLSSASIKIIQDFYQYPGANPETPPIFRSLKLLLNPSYTASKSDVKYSATVSAAFDNVGTFSNTQVSGLFLQLAGNTRYWDDNQTDNEMSSMTIYGAGASGPGPTTVSHYVNKKKLSIQTGTNREARSRMDYAGQVQNFTMEFDVYVDNGNTEVGCIYRTTNFSNYTDNHAYSTGVQGTTIRLGRGSNSTQSSNGTYTSIASATIALTSQEIHRYKIVINGSNHKIYVDDILYINATDSTYSAAGYCGLRVVNFSGTDGYISFFDNFGIMKALTGTWTSNNISLSGAGSYGGSGLFWEDYSIDPQSTDILVETSVNGGSSYQTGVNGGEIANLTLGQSLSGVNLKLKVTLTTATASSMPQLRYLVARVLGAFSSSGTRVAPVLDLSPAGTVGSTLVSWNADTPANTSVTVATSPNGSSYTNVSNGNPIAGITTPFAPAIDTFDTNTSASYTNTHATGGSNATLTFNTSNSRLDVTSGNLGLVTYNTLSSASNVDILVDMDQSDTGGMIWRYGDISNYYQLYVADASASSNANTIILYKRLSGTRTQKASGVISFTRGTPHRIRVIMSGALISVYFDDDTTALLTYTDPSPLSAGKVGLAHDSGTSHFYNFRVDELGASLASTNAYGKITLSSTDPEQTPRVDDFVVAALSPYITKGALIPNADYRRTYVDNNLDDLSDKSNTYWQIDVNKKMIFLERYAIPAPWILTSKDFLLKAGVDAENSGDTYRNREILTGVAGTITKSETFIGNGKDKSWTLGYALIEEPTILLNGTEAMAGVKGGSGFDFYWEAHSPTITQDDAGTLLVEVDELSVPDYVAEYETEVVRDNTGGFTGTVSQSAYATLSGGSGIVEHVMDVKDLNMSVEEAQVLGDGLLLKHGVIGKIIKGTTEREGLDVGQYLPIFLPEHGINDLSALITNIEMTQIITVEAGTPTQRYRYAIEAVSGPNLKSWSKTLAKVLK